MATMEVFSKDYNVVYVDLAGVAGSGVTPADSLNDLPIPANMVDNTVYLCRRDDTNFHSITADSLTSTTFDSIFVLGMPISGDNLYEHAPTEAKLAWDGDTDEYFQFDYTHQSYDWGFNNIKNVGFHRVMFAHKQNSTSSQFNLQLISGTQLGQCFVTYCKFIDYTSNNTTLTDLSDPLFITNTNNIHMKVYINLFGRVLFSNNTVHQSLDFDSQFTNHYSIYMNKNTEVICDDNVVYQSSSRYTGAQYGIIIQAGASVYFRRNKGYYVAQLYTSPIFNNMFYLKGEYVECTDIEITDLRYYGDVSTYYSDVVVMKSLFIKTEGVVGDTGGVIVTKNINIHFDHVKKCIQNVFTADNRDETNVLLDISKETTMADSVISDINVTYNESITGGIGPDNGGAAYSIYIKSLYGKIENISGGDTNSYGIDAYYTDYMKNLHIKGKSKFTAVGLAEMNSWEFLGDPTYITSDLIYNINSTIYIKDALISDDWGSNNWIRNGFQWSGQVEVQSRTVINNVNKIPAINWEKPPATLSGVWANNVASVPGFWHSSNKYYLGQTWSTARVDGGFASIKLTTLTATNSSIGLWIAPPSFKGIQHTPVSTGTLTLKVYVAFKELDEDELSKKFQVHLDAPTINSGIKSVKRYTSTFDGSWADDLTSTWVGDVGLTQKVLSMPFDVELLEAVNVRMKFSWFHSTGYMYLDPKIVFE